MVHAKYVFVCSVKTVSWRPARNTRVLAAYRSQRIGAITGRTTGAGSGSVMTGGAMHTRRYQGSSCVSAPAGPQTVGSGCLAQADVSDPRSNPLGPLVFLFTGDSVSAMQPPRERIPRCSDSIPACPEGERPFALLACPLLHESHEASSDAFALTASRDVDVIHLE